MQHPGEGMIHAWLDGELPEDQANEIAAHARDCAECSAKVAEARGLIAASTRILTALDDVPTGVIPEAPGTIPPSTPARRRRWFDRADIRAAAAVLVVAGASYMVMKRDSGTTTDSLMVADGVESVPMTASKDTPVVPATPKETAAIAPPVVAQRTTQPSARRAEAPPTAGEVEKPLTKTAVAGEVSQSPAMVGMDAAAAAAPPSSLRIAGAAAALAPRARADTAFGVIEGRVVEQGTDKGLGGAQVLLRGTAMGAYTDGDGRFSITNVPPGEKNLMVRRIGYAAQVVAVAVPDDASVTTNVALMPAGAFLSEAVVTGVAKATTTATASARVAASTSPRVVSVDSTTSTRRTIYEISPGVRITLVDSSASTVKEESLLGGQLQGRVANVPQRSAKAADTKAVSSVVNTISWTESGHRYELSGPLTVEKLQALRRQLTEQKR